MTEKAKEQLVREEHLLTFAEALNIPAEIHSENDSPDLELIGLFPDHDDAQLFGCYLTACLNEACDNVGSVMQLSSIPGFALYFPKANEHD